MITPQDGLSNAEKIHEFHDTVGAPLPRTPQVPEAAHLQFRMKLIQEEFQELFDEYNQLNGVIAQNGAVNVLDLQALLHEMADLLYVTYGGIQACGVDADALFAEIHRANLQKAGGPRRADGKILKPEGWQPADVTGVLHRLLNMRDQTG